MKKILFVMPLMAISLLASCNNGGGDKPQPTEPTSITLSDNEEMLYSWITTPYTLTASVLPETAIDKSVTWTSSDTDIVEVIDGKCTAKAIGEATITAKTCNGLTATCEIEVVGPVIVNIKKGDIATRHFSSPVSGTTVMRLDDFNWSATINDDKVDVEFTNISWTCVNTTDNSLSNRIGACMVDKSGEIIKLRLAYANPDTTEIGATYHDDKTSWTWNLSDAPFVFSLRSDE